MRRPTLLLSLGLCLWAGAARAQSTGLPADRFVPAIGAEPFLQTEGGRTPRRWELHLVAALGGLTRPLLLNSTTTGAELAVPVADRATLDLAGEIGLPFGLSVGLGLPISLWQDGDRLQKTGPDAGPAANPTSAQPLAAAGVGDIRLRSKWALLAPRYPVALAVLLELTLPGGGQGDFIASGAPTFASRLLFSGRYRRFSAGVDAGVRLRARRDLYRTPIGHGLDVSAAAALALWPKGVSVIAEVAGEVWPLVSPSASLSWPLEGRGAARVELPWGLTVDAGAGAGLNHQPLAPAWRVFALVRGRLGPWGKKTAARP